MSPDKRRDASDISIEALTGGEEKTASIFKLL